jgi:hypothetical protein
MRTNGLWLSAFAGWWVVLLGQAPVGMLLLGACFFLGCGD